MELPPQADDISDDLELLPVRPEAKATYTEKTERLLAIGQLIKAISPFIWGLVLIVVLTPLIGNLLIHRATSADQGQAPPEIIVPPQIDWDSVDQAVADAVRSAHSQASSYALAELDSWEDNDLKPRLDNFLDWYFGYFNQKWMEAKMPFVWLRAAGWHAIKSDSPRGSDVVEEQLTQEFQREFAKRVLLPKTAQLKLELVTQSTVELYADEFSEQLILSREKYKIPQAQWNRYLNDIAVTVADTEGNISNLSMKAVVGGGGYLLAKPLIAKSVGKIGSKIGAKVAETALTKTAAKTGAAIAAEFGTSLIDPLAGVGILLWDVLDYRHTVSQDRPVLKENLLNYLDSMKQSLLQNPETGIMASVHQLEEDIYNSL